MTAKKMEVTNLTVRFGEFLAVNNLSFDVYEGEIIGFLGPNGAGKTTTIKAIFDVIPYEGKITIHGKRELIGWMPQNSPLYLNLTVEENLKFFASIYGMRKGIDERVEGLLELVELSDYRKRLVKNLSGGMKQRLMLACSMVHDPDLLILDEPTAGVDPPLRKSFWEHFEKMNAEGKTILVTTHYMDEAENCHRLILMRNGEKIAEGSPDVIKKRALGGELIHLEVDEKEKSFNLLKANGYKVELNEDLKILVDDSGESLPEILNLLRDNNIRVLRSETSAASLEEAFMKIIEV